MTPDFTNLPSRRYVRDRMGRGLWTTKQYADAHGIAVGTARRWVRALTNADIVRLEKTRPLKTEKGEPKRGRPVNLYRVPIGEDA